MESYLQHIVEHRNMVINMDVGLDYDNLLDAFGSEVCTLMYIMLRFRFISQ